jgi:hypothetical protein
MKRIEVGKYIILVRGEDDMFVIEKDLLAEMEGQFADFDPETGFEITLESGGKLDEALNRAALERDPAYPFTVIDIDHFSIDEFPFK